MKKSIALTAVALTSLLLTACGSNGNNSSKSSSSSEKTVKVPKSTAKYYFKDDVANLTDIKIKITKVKVIKAHTGENVTDKNLLTFWYDVTNKSDKDINTINAWQAVFNAYQDNDKDRENKLNVGYSPDSKTTEHQLDRIKKNGTVKGVTAYDLTDLKTPVKLVATKGDDGNKLGTQTYKLK